MEYNYFYLIFICIIAFIQSPKPENIQIFEIDDFNYYEEYVHEFTTFKNQIFGLQFIKGRGIPCFWSHSFKRSNYISFLNSSIYDYLGEECQKENEIAKKVSNSTFHYFPKCIHGGSEYYYEIFKALDVANQPQSLNFSYYCYSDGIPIINESINIWICDEVYKDQCINNETTKCFYNKESNSCISKPLCDKIKNVSKSSCESAVTSTPSLTKCSYEKPENGTNTNEKCKIKNLCINSLTEEECASAEPINPKAAKCVYDKIQNICKEEKKYCTEIDNGATKDICSGAKVSDANKICVLDNESHLCNEVYIMKDDAGDIKKNLLLCFLLYLLLFI